MLCSGRLNSISSLPGTKKLPQTHTDTHIPTTVTYLQETLPLTEHSNKQVYVRSLLVDYGKVGEKQRLHVDGCIFLYKNLLFFWCLKLLKSVGILEMLF